MTPRWTVMPMPSATMSFTSRSGYLYDGPRSPRTMPPTQLRYWIGIGSSRPYFALSREIVAAGSRFSRSHGPPGAECISVNVMTDTTNRTGMIHRTRRTMYPTTAATPSW